MKKKIALLLMALMIISLVPVLALGEEKGTIDNPYLISDLADGNIVNGADYIDFSSGTYGFNIYDSLGSYAGDSDRPLGKFQIMNAPDSDIPSSNNYIDRGFFNPLDYEIDLSSLDSGWIDFYVMPQVNTEFVEQPEVGDETISLSIDCYKNITGKTVTLQIYENDTLVETASTDFVATTDTIYKDIPLPEGVKDNKTYYILASVDFTVPYVEKVITFTDSNINSWANPKNWDFDWYTDSTENTFHISSEEQFAAFAAIVNGDAITEGYSSNSFNGKTIVLDNDLDLSEKVWKPIGNYWSSYVSYADEECETGKTVVYGQGYFLGDFDGNNHSITYKMDENGTYFEECSLFGLVYGGSIGNLTVDVTAYFPTIYGTTSFGLDNRYKEIKSYVSGVASFVDYNAHIYNVTANGTITVCNYTGQASGIAYVAGPSTFENCVNNVDIHIGQYYRKSTEDQYAIAGGIICQTSLSNSTSIYLDNCINHGDISIDNPFDNPCFSWTSYGNATDGTRYSMKLNAGGLIGQISSATGYVVIDRNCYTDGEIEGSSIEQFNNGSYVGMVPSTAGSFVGKMWEYNEGNPQLVEYSVSTTDNSNSAFYPNTKLIIEENIIPSDFNVTDYVTFSGQVSTFKKNGYYYRKNTYNSSVVYNDGGTDKQVNEEQLKLLNQSCSLLGPTVYADVCISDLPATTTNLVTLDANGGYFEGDNSFTVSAKSLYPELPEPAKEGYEFLGWYTKTNWKEKEFRVFEGNPVNICEDTTLVAKWEANDYTVKYNGNGGNGSMEAQAFKYDVKQELSTNTFTRSDGYSFAGWSTMPNGIVEYGNSQSVMNLTDKSEITLFAIWTEKTANLGITITCATNSDVSVEIKRGASVIELSPKTPEISSPGYEASFSVLAIPYGTYNVVVKQEDTIITKLITINGNANISVDIPDTKTNSIVNVEADTLAVLVGNLNEEAAEQAETDKNVYLLMNIQEEIKEELSTDAPTEEQNIQAAITAISNKADEEATEIIEKEYINITIEKYVSDEKKTIEELHLTTPTDILENTNKVIELVIPYDLTNKSNIKIYRYHGDVAEPFINNDSKADGTFSLDYENNLIYIHTNKFSVYGIVYSSTDPLTQIILINASDNGVVNVVNTDVVPGEYVNLEAIPNTGYILDRFVVTDKNGDYIEVNDNRFILPEGLKLPVTIDAYFKSSYTSSGGAVAAPATKETPTVYIGEDKPVITVNVDNNIYTNSDKVLKAVAPIFIENGRTYLGIRDIAYTLGIKPEAIKWDKKNKTATISKAGAIIEVTQDSDIVKLTYKEYVYSVKSDASAINKNDRIYLPFRVIFQLFGYEVNWDNETRTITCK